MPNPALDDEDSLPAPAPFWHRLNTFFGLPLQGTPLLYALALAASSLLVLPLGAVIGLPLAVVVVALGLLLAVSRYGFKVMALGARGIFRAADYPHRMEEDVTALPWKLFLVLLAQGFAAGLVQRLFGEGMGLLATGVVSLVMPATVMVILLTGSGMAALNPARLWDTMAVVGWPYLLLFFFLYLLNGGMGFGAVFVVTKIGRTIAIPLLSFVVIYFSWVMFALLGYVIYQHHRAFGIDLLPGGEADEGRPQLTPEQQAQRAADKEVAGLVASGDVPAALALAYEAQRIDPTRCPRSAATTACCCSRTTRRPRCWTTAAASSSSWCSNRRYRRRCASTRPAAARTRPSCPRAAPAPSRWPAMPGRAATRRRRCACSTASTSASVATR